MKNLQKHFPKTPQIVWDLASFLGHTLLLTAAYFSVEVLIGLFLHTQTSLVYSFGFCWSLIFASVAMLLPRRAGRIFFGITYFAFAAWGLAQIAHFDMFHKLMWFSSSMYAGEGAVFILDIVRSIPILWWPALALMIAIGVLLIRFFPKNPKAYYWRIGYSAIILACALFLATLPAKLFLRDDGVWGTHSEYGQSSSWRATYKTMYDAEALYSITGFYHLTFRDFYWNLLYPLTPAYQKALAGQAAKIDQYFKNRHDHADNDMTGIYKDKNVVYVLMESMDDWMITPEDTPTLYRLMGEGINFTNFFTPGYGSARTLNSEFCMNSGVYLPTNARYLFDYITNSFKQSIAHQVVENGYTAEVFHYNTPEFYSRGVLEKALGYRKYNSYGTYTSDKNKLYDDCLLFEIPELSELFFRDGQTFNTIITRSAHLSYKYNEVLSHWALKKYPEYKGMYGSQEEDCARLKAKLVDDLFARLLSELEANGKLQDTVIVAMTDHFAYGYKDLEELYAHSGVDHELLLEKTPCFVWSADKPSIQVDKIISTVDLVPTLLNLFGIDSPYTYLGQDAFDSRYEGYVYFPDGSFIADGVIAFRNNSTASYDIVANEKNIKITNEYLLMMQAKAEAFIQTNNLLLTSNYYKNVR